MYFEDCTSPSVQLMERFLKIAEKAGIVAVHCYAGLGRTGTLISAFLIKHTDFTALEAVAWLRILRPGSVIGRQQDFLQQHEQLLKKAGRQK
ncbi:dual specificity protein phosphatase CDC14B-like [Phlebotomus argentipes]|uniref:dual specificity protein phosphatase CDC14B-like n=1 Tax=Phlebotomus argentipes TaxID=94469 RepID=UPI0028931B2F|nr:dual specificity protein phosphatase CDC14B-like [Phlebotomus argentipes]